MLCPGVILQSLFDLLLQWISVCSYQTEFPLWHFLSILFDKLYTRDFSSDIFFSISIHFHETQVFSAGFADFNALFVFISGSADVLEYWDPEF